MLRRTGMLAITLCLLSIVLTGNVKAKALLEEFKATEVSGQAYVLADATCDGVMELVIGSKEAVYIMVREEGRYQTRWRIDSISSGVRTLAVGDIDNDTWPDLLIGTGQAGSIRIFGWDGEKFVRKGETDYLWSPVSDILIIDIDGDGWKDILAVTESGSAQVLRWDGLRYRRIWEHSASSGRIKFFQTADLDGDGVDELVYALVEGRVVVAQWDGTELATIWENYPWGTVSTVALSDLDGDARVEILVTTEQQMLYSYGWTKNGIALKASFSDPAIKFLEAIGADLDGDGKGELVAVDAQGIKVWKIARDKLQLLAQAGFINEPHELRLTPGGDGLILLDRDGALRSLRLVDDNYFRLLIGDTVSELSHPPVWADGEPLLAARDVADLLGLTIYWDAEQRRLTAIRDGVYAVLQAEDLTMYVSGVTVPLRAALQVKGAESYVPIEFVRVFAAEVSWDAASRTLRMIP